MNNDMLKVSIVLAVILSLVLVPAYASPDPEWHNASNYTPIYYNAVDFSEFNMTWINNIDITIIEYNWTLPTKQNSTMSNLYGGDIFTHSAVIPAGSWYWKSYANDTGDNWNTSSKFYITILPAPTSFNLWLDEIEGNASLGQGDTANFTALLNASGKTINMDSDYPGFDPISNTTSVIYNSTNLTTTGNDYNLTVWWDGDNNYTSSSKTWFFNVSDLTPPTITLYIPENNTWFTNTSVNETENITQNFTFTPSDASGLDNCTFTLYNITNEPAIQVFLSNPINDSNSTVNLTWNGSEPDVRYNWDVGCYDTSGNLGSSTNWTWGIDRQPPVVNAPHGVGWGCAKINITWSGNDVASGIVGYILYETVSNVEEWIEIFSTNNASITRYDDRTVSREVNYKYMVQATDFVGHKANSTPSLEVTPGQECGGGDGGDGGNGGETFIADTNLVPPTAGSFDIVNFEPVISINPGEVKTSKFTIKNTNANNILTITVSLTGVPAEWFTLSKTSIDNLLHDIGEEIVTITFTIPGDATPGDTTLTMKATGTEAFTGKAMTAEATNTLRITGEVTDTVVTGENPLTGLFALITENPVIFLIGSVGIIAVLYTRFKDKIHNFFQTRIFRKGPAYKPKKLN
jgi:hypothetical protein